ncbi:MAG: signal peptidase I [Methylobacillus sp.]|nr:signal peptidase I [Methylobacillus sp.]
MNWKPNRWIAVVLNLILWPFGFLYVDRWRWAAFYFALYLLTAIFIIYILLGSHSFADWSVPVLAVLLAFFLISIIQIFIFATRAQPMSRRPWYSRWYGIAAAFLILVLSPIFIFRAFFHEPFYLPSASMEPSYAKGDCIFISKSGYGNYGTFGVTVYKSQASEPLHHGDVVVFDYPLDPSQTYVKRVIGSPGDNIVYQSKALWINDQPVSQTPLHSKQDEGKFAENTYDVLQESFDSANWQIQISRDYPDKDFEITVPPHMYFVMGDNRDNSMDSRHFGFVPESAIKGKVVSSFHC